MRITDIDSDNKNEFRLDEISNQIYNEIHDNAKACFILSTGRCGTKLLTKIMNGADNILSYHEPMPKLIYYSKFAYENQDNLSDTLKILIDGARLEYLAYATLNNKLYFEGSNRITFFADQLSELFPKAKFIHLIRNPINFTISGLKREWYCGNDLWEMGRIIPQDNSINWNDMSQVAKIAWLWNETNKFIESFKSNLNDQSRIKTIFSEELFNDINVIEEVFNFLDYSVPYTQDQMEQLITQPVNASEFSPNLQYKYWSKDQKRALKKYAKLATKYSYNL
ncbi:sulfotransferase [Sporohalobacter salinus]|uniref:sulfotransferase n=1 Tax=Sporohalobacter salinus TaxID=1494606 RepID=UPI001960AF6F|nr:sulfotransferase [Sporohalobacter salinus]MBM7623041.1 hypothetical protein [Sporohalobacter salinus]